MTTTDPQAADEYPPTVWGKAVHWLSLALIVPAVVAAFAELLDLDLIKDLSVVAFALLACGCVTALVMEYRADMAYDRDHLVGEYTDTQEV